MSNCKVAVLGAAGGIGQPLSLLLKQSHQITDLALFDVVPVVKGVAVDLSHIATPSNVLGYTKDDEGLSKALKGAHTVVIPAGVPRKPGMTRDDLFNINASIVRDLAQGIAQNCPDAFVCVISNPVNSTVPIVAEVLKQAGVFNPKKLFGVTTLDVLRAQTFAAENVKKPLDSAKFSVPVVGGHSGTTIVPLFSQAQPSVSSLDQKTLEALTNRVQFGGDEVVKAKDGGGSATLSMAAAGYRFVQALLDAKVGGKSGIVEMGYVLINSDIPGAKDVQKELGTDIDFCSVPVELDANGAKSVKPIGKVSDYEKKLLDAAIPELKGNISKGVSFIQSKL